MPSSSNNLFQNPASPSSTTPPNPTKSKFRAPGWLFPVLLVLAFAAVFAWFFRDRFLPAHPVEVVSVVLLSDLDRGEFEQTEAEPKSDGPDPDAERMDFDSPMLFQAAGWFEPDPLPIRATALVDGVVEQVHVLEGETVTKGQPLASLIADDVELKLAASRRTLEEITAEHHMHLAMIPAVKAKAAAVGGKIDAARAMLEELEDKFQRIGSLSEGTVSKQEVIAAELAVESQKSEVAALESERAAELANLEAINTQSHVFDARIAAAKVAIAENELARSRIDIVSPVDGVVLELKAAPGQKKMLAMDEPDSATIAVLFETGKLQARVDVPLADAAGLMPGQPAIITSDFLPNAEFRGVVTRIVGAADLQRNTLQAKVRVIDPDPRLRPEMLCRVKFLQPDGVRSQVSDNAASTARSGRASSRALFVPSDVVIDQSGNSASVWAVSSDGTRAKRKSIELGSLQIDGLVEVASGLLAGERVILPPHDSLSEGRRVRILSSSPSH